MEAEILSIGEELLLGEVLDTNAAWLAEQLLPWGVQVRRRQVVGDRLVDVAEAFSLALSRADLVVATGGLGPTEDDLTREGLARCLGRRLEYRSELMERLARRLGRRVEELSENNRRQALVFAGAEVLENERGTAPGQRIEHAGRSIYLFPGVPQEMKWMAEAYLLPHLSRHTAGGERLFIKRLLCFGRGESAIAQRITHLFGEERNPKLGTRACGGVVTIRLVGRGRDEAAARAAVEPVEREVRTALGELIFGEDEADLATVTVKMLLEKRLTVAIAESCTAGLICALLGEVPGVSGTLLEGVVAYSNEAKVREVGVAEELLAAHGAVSEAVARALAEGVRRQTGADLGLGVTGVAGPAGGSAEKPVGTVHLALSSAWGTSHQRHFFPGERNWVRLRAAHSAIDLLRRRALELGKARCDTA